MAVCLVGLALAQDPQPPRTHDAVRWFTVHDVGVQVRVTPPALAGGSWLLEVHDLGPDVPALKHDLVPTEATLQLLGHVSVSLHARASGTLAAELPRAWLRDGRLAGARLQVASQGQRLFDYQVEALLW